MCGVAVGWGRGFTLRIKIIDGVQPIKSFEFSFKGLDTFGRFFANLDKGQTFVTSGLPSCIPKFLLKRGLL